MTPNTYIHSALWRWLQVAFAPPAPLWRVEGSGAELISESEALKAGALGFLRWVQASRAALAACPPSSPRFCWYAQGCTFDGGCWSAYNPRTERPQCQSQAEAARCRSPASPRDHALAGPVRSCPVGGSEMLASWGSGGHLGGGLVPPGDPQSQATLSSPAPRAQGGLLDGAPASPKRALEILFRRALTT